MNDDNDGKESIWYVVGVLIVSTVLSMVIIFTLTGFSVAMAKAYPDFIEVDSKDADENQAAMAEAFDACSD